MSMPNPDDAAATPRGYRSHAYYLHTQQHHERLKAAWWGTRHTEQPVDEDDLAPSLNALVARLFEAEAARLEAKYNAGEPFPPAPKQARGVDPSATSRQGQTMTDLWSERRGRGAPETR